MTFRQRFILTPAPATVPEVGVLLAVLHDARLRTLNRVKKISGLDAVTVGHHSAGTLLYHIALIEMNWLYADVLEKAEDDFSADARDWFPLDARGEEGHLSIVTSEPLERHLARRAWVRGPAGHHLYRHAAVRLPPPPCVERPRRDVRVGTDAPRAARGPP